jgi:hypothetical protein
VKRDEILAFAKQQFGKITNDIKKGVDDIFEKSPLQKVLDRRKTGKQSIDERKVLDMEGKVLDPDQPILGGKQTKMETPSLEFNVEKFIEDFPVSREEAVRISQLPRAERRVILQKYIDNDMRQQIELMDFEPPKDRKPSAMGGRIGYGSGTPSKNRFTQLMLLKEEALEKGDMDKVRQIQSDIDKEFGKAQGGRIGYDMGGDVSYRANQYLRYIEEMKSMGVEPVSVEEFNKMLDAMREKNAQGGRIGYADGTENMMAAQDYSSSAYRMKLIGQLMDTGGLDYGAAVKEADRIIEIKLRPKKKLAAGGLPNILGF